VSTSLTEEDVRRHYKDNFTSIVCRRKDVSPDPGHYTILADVQTGFAHYTIHDACYENARTSILERVFFTGKPGNYKTPPRPQPGYIRKTCSNFRKVFFDNIEGDWEPVLCIEFVESCYKGKKLKKYLLELDAIVDYDEMDEGRVAMFIKVEKIFSHDVVLGLVNSCTKVRKSPRAIQPRSPRYNLQLGRFLNRHTEHIIFETINKMFQEVTVFKGMNALEMGEKLAEKYSKFNNPIVVITDASRWDQHCSKEALEFEHSFYLRLFNNHPELRKLLSKQLYNRCQSITPDGFIKYKNVGGRKSGDMNTGLGNVVLMCGYMYTYWVDYCKIPVSKISIFDNGDDCGIIIEKQHEEFIKGMDEFFLQLGYKMETEEPVKNLEQISFCQMSPIEYEVGKWVMMRRVNAFDKDLISPKKLNKRVDWDRARNAIGQCGLALTSRLPMYRSFYKMLYRGSEYVTHPDFDLESGMWRLSVGMKASELGITNIARESFERCTGIDVYTQLFYEHYFDNIHLSYSDAGEAPSSSFLLELTK